MATPRVVVGFAPCKAMPERRPVKALHDDLHQSERSVDLCGVSWSGLYRAQRRHHPVAEPWPQPGERRQRCHNYLVLFSPWPTTMRTSRGCPLTAHTLTAISLPPSDGSPYEKRVDAKGRVTSDRCITDEMPFEELPEGWAWARLESALFNRDAERVPVSVADREKLDKIYDYYGASGVIDKVDSYLFDKPLLLVGEDGANLLTRSKPIAFIARGKYWVNNHAHVLDGISEGYLEYIALYINSINLAPYVTGTAQPKMNQAKMGLILIPIPPLAEQRCIVERVNELMPLVEEYGRLEDAREELDAALPGRLRKSVLQLAVQGGLVPQDPADEPAAVLLERIRGRRRQLVAKGEMKAPKGGESIIFAGSDGRRYEKRVDARGRESEPVCIEDEIPFEIPESWEWRRLGSLVLNRGQKRPEARFAYIDISSIDNVNQKLGQETVINAADAPSRARKLVAKNDVLYATVRPYLHNACIVDKDFNIKPIASTGFAVLSCLDGFLPSFLLYFLVSPSFDSYANANENAKGVAYPAINDNRLYRALVPVPPASEQKRIVSRVTEVFALTN